MRLKLRIDWSEQDIFNHVNNVAFAKYMQASRVNLMEALGIMETYAKQKIGFMVAASSIIYRKPLNYPGQIEIETKVHEIKNTSFLIKHQIFNEANDLCAEGEDVIVYFDFNRNEKLTLNGDLLERLNFYKM